MILLRYLPTDDCSTEDCYCFVQLEQTHGDVSTLIVFLNFTNEFQANSDTSENEKYIISCNLSKKLYPALHLYKPGVAVRSSETNNHAGCPLFITDTLHRCRTPCGFLPLWQALTGTERQNQQEQELFLPTGHHTRTQLTQPCGSLPAVSAHHPAIIVK